MADAPANLLSSNESVVARGIADGHSIDALAEQVGLDTVSCYRILSRPHVEAEVLRIQKRKMQWLASKMLRNLRDIAKEKPKSLAEKRLHADIAKMVFDRAGLGAASAAGAAAGGKRTSELSLDQIQQALNEMKVKASDAAKVIDVTPSEAPDNAQPATQDIDIFS